MKTYLWREVTPEANQAGREAGPAIFKLHFTSAGGGRALMWSFHGFCFTDCGCLHAWPVPSSCPLSVSPTLDSCSQSPALSIFVKNCCFILCEVNINAVVSYLSVCFHITRKIKFFTFVRIQVPQSFYFVFKILAPFPIYPNTQVHRKPGWLWF